MTSGTSATNRDVRPYRKAVGSRGRSLNSEFDRLYLAVVGSIAALTVLLVWSSFLPGVSRVLIAIFLLIGFVVGGMVFRRRFHRVVTLPIERLSQATERIAEGDLSVQAEAMTSIRELSTLTEHFNVMSRKLEAAVAALKESNRDLEEFARVASHDLQEPVRKITSFGELLRSSLDGELDEEQAHYLARVLDAASRMRALINSLLMLSRVTTRGQEHEPIDMAEIAAEVVGGLELSLAESGGAVQIGEIPAVQADPTQVPQLLENLIGNAIRYRRKDAAPVIELGGSVTEEGFVEVIVRDNGIGFEPRFAEQIFGVFERLHNREDIAGTGIGLAICRKIVERHGGRIWAESAPGEGAAFHFTLPPASVESDEEHDVREVPMTTTQPTLASSDSGS